MKQYCCDEFKKSVKSYDITESRYDHNVWVVFGYGEDPEPIYLKCCPFCGSRLTFTTPADSEEKETG